MSGYTAFYGLARILTHSPNSPRYLPEQWSPHVHPEGQKYFSRSIALRVVTDSYMYTPSIAEKVMYWVPNIEKRAADRGFILSDSVELYIQIDDEDCNYYLADHATKTIFWLDEYETSELGLLPVVSSSHLSCVSFVPTQYSFS